MQKEVKEIEGIGWRDVSYTIKEWSSNISDVKCKRKLYKLLKISLHEQIKLNNITYGIYIYTSL